MDINYTEQYIRLDGTQVPGGKKGNISRGNNLKSVVRLIAPFPNTETMYMTIEFKGATNVLGGNIERPRYMMELQHNEIVNNALTNNEDWNVWELPLTQTMVAQASKTKNTKATTTFIRETREVVGDTYVFRGFANTVEELDNNFPSAVRIENDYAGVGESSDTAYCYVVDSNDVWVAQTEMIDDVATPISVERFQELNDLIRYDYVGESDEIDITIKPNNSSFKENIPISATDSLQQQVSNNAGNTSTNAQNIDILDTRVSAKAEQSDLDITNTNVTSNTNRIATNELDINTNKNDITATNVRIDDLIGGAPESLDTLNELAQALNDNENFATDVINQINTKSDKTYVDARDNELQTQITINKDLIDAGLGFDSETLITRTEFESINEGQDQNIQKNVDDIKSNTQKIEDLEKDAITRYKTELSYDTNVVGTMEINTPYVIPLKVDLQSEDTSILEAQSGDGFANINAGLIVKTEEELLINLTANLTNTGTNTNNATICLYRDEDGTLENATQLACKLIEIPKASINGGVAIGSLVFQDNVLTENLNKLFFLTLEIDNQLITLNNLTWKSQIGIPTDMSAYQLKQDNGLNTQDKTVVGGINELEQQVDDVLNGTLIVNKALKTATDRNIDDELNANANAISTNAGDILTKQNSTDNSLTTTSQNVVGAINEVNENLIIDGKGKTATSNPTVISNNNLTPDVSAWTLENQWENLGDGYAKQTYNSADNDNRATFNLTEAIKPSTTYTFIYDVRNLTAPEVFVGITSSDNFASNLNITSNGFAFSTMTSDSVIDGDYDVTIRIRNTAVDNDTAEIKLKIYEGDLTSYPEETLRALFDTESDAGLTTELPTMKAVIDYLTSKGII